jgi:DNA-binding NarL/FixJ family response regulator
MVLRILIADDHDFIRLGIRALLTQHPGWEVCDEATTGLEAVRKVEDLQPDIAILDIGMPDLDGIGAAKQIRKISPTTEILILSMHHSDQLTREIVELGIRGYIVKSDSDRDLVTAVEHLAKHKPYFNQQAVEVIFGFFDSACSVGKMPEKVRDRLTLREREIVGHLANGLSGREIASLLGISLKTVETHRANMMQKLGTHTITDLVRYAIRNDIVKP